MIACKLIILDLLPVPFSLIIDQQPFRIGCIDDGIVVLKHRQHDAFHAGIVFAICRVFASALVPKAAMNDAIAKKQQMPSIDAAVPVVLG